MFTLSKLFAQDTVKTFVGTPCYMAPEVMEQLQGYDSKADVWSVGITALELAKGVAPYAHHSPMRVLVLTIEEEPPSLKCYRDGALQRTGEPFSSLFEDFYRKCLQKNPRSRPSAEDLLRHKFLKSHTSGRAQFVSELLSLIPPVGSEVVTSDGRVIPDSEEREQLPGESSVAVTVERWNYDSTDGSNARRAHSRGSGDALSPPSNPLTSASTAKYAKGTTWVFDGDDIDDWKANALGESSEQPKSCSGVVARTSGSFASKDSNPDCNAPEGDSTNIGAASREEVSHYRITVQGVGKSRGTVAPSSSQKPKKQVQGEPIDDFLEDFENEIVLEKPSSGGSSTVSPATVPATVTTPAIADSGSAPATKEENTHELR